MTWTGPNWKPSRTARKKAKLETTRERQYKEQKEKAAVRKRDKGCRFPLCGCKKLGLRIEVSHDVHKGMGGNPAGDRSQRQIMVQLCEHRHQHGAISRHAGTLRSVYLSDDGYEGPVAWEIDTAPLPDSIRKEIPVLAMHDEWARVATEIHPGRTDLLQPWQMLVLTLLADMDL